MNSQVINAIKQTIEQHGGTVEGTETLSLTVGTRKWYLIECTRAMQRDGIITIIPSIGGRGRKTIYKRNRNQPGKPRKS